MTAVTINVKGANARLSHLIPGPQLVIPRAPMQTPYDHIAVVARKLA